jgi:predicted phosphodiesterase
MKFHSVNLGDVERAYLVPVSDIHPEASSFNEKAFKKLLDWLQDTENAYCVLGGDMFESATKNSKGDVYSARMTTGEALRYIRTSLLPIKDKILVSVTGNHEERIYKQEGLDLAEVLANELGIFYADEGCLLKLSLGRRPNNGKPQVYSIYLTHGNGGGKRPGSKLNNMEMLALSVVADLYLVGHGHAEMSFKNRFFLPDLRNEKVEERYRTFVQAGSFQEWAGYAERGGYVPGSQEMPLITLSGTSKEVKVTI